MISEDEFILEDDTYWLYKFDEFTLHIPKCYEKIKGFDRDYIFQNPQLNTEQQRLPIFDSKEYSANKWSWINDHCVVRGHDLYYTPKKLEIDSTAESTETQMSSFDCCCIFLNYYSTTKKN